MMLARMFDASRPPAEPVPGCAAVAGYIGGNTPHTWTLEEWQRFGHLRQLPIWVASFADAFGPVAQGRAAALTAIGLGWRPHLYARRAIVLDMETSEDAAFVRQFADAVHVRGFSCWVYGSESTIGSLPAEDGRWVAEYPGGGPVLPSQPGVAGEVAHQYRADVPAGKTAVDLSVISVAALDHLGRGPRHGLKP